MGQVDKITWVVIRALSRERPRRSGLCEVSLLLSWSSGRRHFPLYSIAKKNTLESYHADFPWKSAILLPVSWGLLRALCNANIFFLVGKGKGTPALRNGIRCTQVDDDNDSDVTDWQGFDWMWSNMFENYWTWQNISSSAAASYKIIIVFTDSHCEVSAADSD